MFRNAHFERTRQAFADQFERDGGAFLYRKSLKGPPIRVSEAERDDFIAIFGRHLRILSGTFMAAIVALIFLLAIVFPDIDAPHGKAVLYVATGMMIALFMGGYFRAWNRPARCLERRPAEGRALTREEVKRMMFARMTYGQLGLVVVLAIIMLATGATKNDVLHGWGLIWPVFSAGLIMLAGVQAVRKRRFDRSR